MTTTTKIVDEILEDSIGMDLCGGKECSGYQRYEMTKQSLRTLFEKAFDEVIGEDEPGVTNIIIAAEHSGQRQRAKAKLTEMFG